MKIAKRVPCSDEIKKQVAKLKSSRDEVHFEDLFGC
jgi:hypothetical protein